MALNIAVPLSGLGGLSPISPIGIDCWENIKILVSPIGSESSGVSSLDSEEAKQQVRPIPPRKPEAIKQELRINYNGRNVLDLYNNLETNSTSWKFQYSHLPENNISMFLANRSLYNRLGPNGLTPVYTINKCECCDFQYTSDCPTSYLSETSLNMSSTTTSPMIFTTASNTKQDYHTTKVTTVSAQVTSNVAAAINNQQSFTGYKSGIELPNKQFCNQNNVNKAKLNDILLKKNNLTNSNNNYNTIYKFNNLIGSTKNANDVTQLASALVAANIPNSPPNTPSNMMIGYSNNTMHHNGSNEQMTNNLKCNVPQNFFNCPLTLTNTTNPNPNPVAANHNFHGNTNHVNTNNVLLNHNNCNNKPQISTSNNFYSLFNSNNTNNSAMYSLNANANANGNSNNNNNNYINSFNTISNNGNNINNNPLTVNSQHYGRMYKYF